MRAHMVGVAVSETSIDKTIVTESVIANWRNRRPTTPPISKMGMNTATSEILMERTVGPISAAPRSAASIGLKPSLAKTRNIFQNHNRVVNHKAARNSKSHERQIVDAEAEQIHYAASSNNGDGNGDARNQGGARFAKENENYKNNQANRDHQRPLDIVNRRANRYGLIESYGKLDGRVDGGIELRQCLFDGIHRVDNIGARLAENDDQRGGFAVGQPEGANRLHRIVYRCDVIQSHRRAILIFQQNAAGNQLHGEVGRSR